MIPAMDNSFMLYALCKNQSSIHYVLRLFLKFSNLLNFDSLIALMQTMNTNNDHE